MSIPLFFAMSKQEIQENIALPDKIAWMSCHFSASGEALSSIPANLPRNAMLILDDRIPFKNHDSILICSQMEDLVRRFACSHVLLDFERPPLKCVLDLAEGLIRRLPCPVGVSATYGLELNCPVFVPPIPPHVPPADYLKTFRNREIWLEIALDGSVATVTKEGCSFETVPLPDHIPPVHRCQELQCHYSIDLQQDSIRFSFHRRIEDVDALLHFGEPLGVKLAIGLYQELFQA